MNVSQRIRTDEPGQDSSSQTIGPPDRRSGGGVLQPATAWDAAASAGRVSIASAGETIGEAPAHPRRTIRARPARFAGYRDFWAYFLKACGGRGDRIAHLTGVGFAVFCSIVALIENAPWPLPIGFCGILAPVVMAWCLADGRSAPTLIRHPFWLFVSEIRMAAIWACGRLNKKITQARRSSTY